MMKPVWFLDVDGVLNADHAYPKFWDNWNTADVDTKNLHDEDVSLTLHWSDDVVRFVDEMSTYVDVVWLTSWSDSANDLLAPTVGLKGRFPNGFTLAGLSVPSYPKYNDMWNLKKRTVLSLTRNVFANRPVVWTDDDLNKSDRHFFKSVLDDPLLVMPFSDPGLRPVDVDRIRNYVDSHRD